MREAIYNRTIRVTLVDDEWDPVLMEGRATRSYLVADDSPQPSTIWDMIYGLTSRQNEARGFNTLLAINQSSVRVRVPNKYELEIDLPALEAYDIIRPETVDLIVPEAAVLTRDLPVMLGLTAVLYLMCVGWRGPGRVTRLEGSLLLLAFVGYTSILLIAG